MFGVLLVFTLLVLIVSSWMRNGRPKNFPPGPPIIPWIGSIPFMAGAGNNFHLFLEGWHKKYGSVIGFQLGTTPVVAIVGGRAVIEALKHEDFQGRPDSPLVRDRTFGKRLGVIFTDGPYWVEQRRFTNRHLREFGFGKKSMEGLILEEAEDLMKFIKQYGSEPIQVSTFFAVPINSVLWSTMSGTRYERDDEEFQHLLDVLYRHLRAGNPSGNGWYYSLLPSLRGLSAKWRQSQKNLDELYRFLGKIVREHERTLDPTSSRDFIDVYLREMQKGISGSTFHEKSLISICGDLFTAGADSISNILGFCLLYLVRHPEVQTKVQAELDSVVGRNRRVSLDDRQKLVYLEATLLEVMRCNTVAPLSVPHRATKDTSFRGYNLPKGTTLVISLWSCGQDEYWGDAENFRPERFIGEDGKLTKEEFEVTFGTGKRVCLGEALARNTLFLFFATMMQEVTFSLPPGAAKPPTLCLPGFTVAPQPFQVIATERA